MTDWVAQVVYNSEGPIGCDSLLCRQVIQKVTADAKKKSELQFNAEGEPIDLSATASQFTEYTSFLPILTQFVRDTFFDAAKSQLISTGLCLSLVQIVRDAFSWCVFLR